jgi:flagellar biogenesis protein FliO
MAKIGGLAAWLMERFRREPRPPASLSLLERISLAPRQSLALVEAEGRMFLIATSGESTPAVLPLHEGLRPVAPRQVSKAGRARVSW